MLVQFWLSHELNTGKLEVNLSVKNIIIHKNPHKNSVPIQSGQKIFLIGE
jgi:hypothetical protein